MGNFVYVRGCINVAFLLCLLSIQQPSIVEGFLQQACQSTNSHLSRPKGYGKPPSVLYMSDNKEKAYSREILLREEIESPFRKVRFFLYFALGSGALVSFFISGTRVAAALSGINTDLLPQSATNMAIDAAGLVLFYFLNQRDVEAQESRLERLSKGGAIASLLVRANKSLAIDDTESPSDTFTTSLASMRGGRGIEKRVVIAAAGADKIKDTIEEAIRLQDSITISDLLVVPVLLPTGSAPEMDGSDSSFPECIALPVGGSNWKAVIDDEAGKAIEQGVDVETEGFCVIMKKNGRVGQRTKGIYLGRMVGEVMERAESGMDITNI